MMNNLYFISSDLLVNYINYGRSYDKLIKINQVYELTRNELADIENYLKDKLSFTDQGHTYNKTNVQNIVITLNIINKL